MRIWLIYLLDILSTAAYFILVFGKMVIFFSWKLQFVGWKIKQYCVLFFVINFSQLLKFFFCFLIFISINSLCCFSDILSYGVSMALDIFGASLFECKWSNWSIMDWKFSVGSVEILRIIVIVGLYIDLKLIEYQRIVECWSIYFSEIDRISAASWMLLLFLDNLLVRN